MSGIYIHIPFCKKACHYCNFHFSTSLQLKTELLETILKEITLQKDYLQGAAIQTVYLGGGTPSLLTAGELEQIFVAIHKYHSVSADAEITLEANPDDLTKEKLEELRQTPINRLSIGIQSFSEEDLQFMNRAHNASEALQCLNDSRAAGFSQLTIDLIYGTPTLTDQQWASNLSILSDFDLPHLSCYCLTVEPNTALDKFVKTGKVRPVDEQKASRQFEYLMAWANNNNYEHYEISNFAKPGQYARHNSAYWRGIPYLGLGPAAHSFDGKNRQWNIANNPRYIQLIQTGKEKWFEKEILTEKDRYNEYVMTRLRTHWGCTLDEIRPEFHDHFLDSITPLIADDLVYNRKAAYGLTQKGKLFADQIAMELFLI